MYHKLLKNKDKIFSVAPMMDWTDRHCRFFHRQLSHRILLYTEMVTVDAVIYGDRDRLLGHDRSEHPLSCQLGGNDPAKLAEAARIVADYGYDEVNLNVGCPSDRVQNGKFGACLMHEPLLVARLVGAMKQTVDIPVTVKCRIGVDEQDTEKALDDLFRAVVDEGVDALWVHARKAWLEGLSPKQNRDVPPLDYGRVYRLKAANPETFIGINGGIVSIDQCLDHLAHVDGVMLGRAAYQNAGLLTDVDRCIFGDEKVAASSPDWCAICEKMMEYAERECAKGTRLQNITRHMISLFQGMPGARRYRQILSEEARLEGETPTVIERAFGAVIPSLAIERENSQNAA